jgi:hypothetical protein
MAFTGATTYFANKGVLTISGAGGATPTDQVIAIVKDVEINWSAEHVPLYGWGSIKRQAMARHSMKVDVKVGYCKFAPDASGASPWWAFYVISPSDGDTSAGTEDTNSVMYFDIEAKFTGENGDTFTGTVKNVAFNNFPMKASEAQWIKVDMDGQGDDIVWDNT